MSGLIRNLRRAAHAMLASSFLSGILFARVSNVSLQGLQMWLTLTDSQPAPAPHLPGYCHIDKSFD